MKVFLRNTQTGWFYQEPARWTPEQEAAQDFARGPRAIDVVFASHLENVEILLCYDDSQYNILLPVSQSPSSVRNGDS